MRLTPWWERNGALLGRRFCLTDAFGPKTPETRHRFWTHIQQPIPVDILPPAVKQIFTKMGQNKGEAMSGTHTPWKYSTVFNTSFHSGIQTVRFTAIPLRGHVPMLPVLWWWGGRGGQKHPKTHFFPWNKWIRNVDEMWRYRHLVYHFGCSNRCACLRLLGCSKPRRSQPQDLKKMRMLQLGPLIQSQLRVAKPTLERWFSRVESGWTGSLLWRLRPEIGH